MAGQPGNDSSVPFSAGEVEKLLAEYDDGGPIAFLSNAAPRLARAYLALLSENQMLKGCLAVQPESHADGSAPVEATEQLFTSRAFPS